MATDVALNLPSLDHMPAITLAHPPQFTATKAASSYFPW